MPTIREWLTENKPKYTDRLVWMRDCMEALKVGRRAVQFQAARLWPAVHQNAASNLKTKDAISEVIPSGSFLQEIDDVGKIIEFLNSAVGDDYIEEERLRRRFGIPQSRFKDIASLPVFENRRLVYQKPGGSRVCVFSSVKGIEAAKKTLSMARYEV